MLTFSDVSLSDDITKHNHVICSNAIVSDIGTKKLYQ